MQTSIYLKNAYQLEHRHISDPFIVRDDMSIKYGLTEIHFEFEDNIEEEKTEQSRFVYADAPKENSKKLPVSYQIRRPSKVVHKREKSLLNSSLQVM